MIAVNENTIISTQGVIKKKPQTRKRHTFTGVVYDVDGKAEYMDKNFTEEKLSKDC